MGERAHGMNWLKRLFGKPKTIVTSDPKEESRRRLDADWQKLLAAWPYPLRLVTGAEAEAV